MEILDKEAREAVAFSCQQLKTKIDEMTSRVPESVLAELARQFTTLDEVEALGGDRDNRTAYLKKIMDFKSKFEAAVDGMQLHDGGRNREGLHLTQNQAADVYPVIVDIKRLLNEYLDGLVKLIPDCDPSVLAATIKNVGGILALHEMLLAQHPDREEEFEIHFVGGGVLTADAAALYLYDECQPETKVISAKFDTIGNKFTLILEGKPETAAQEK